MSYYYNIREDVEKYPEAIVYIVIGGRNTGKTYGSLKMMVEDDSRFAFIKRTNKDVNILAAGENKYGVDLSPFKSINRDMHTNIKAGRIIDGLGGFWNCNEEGEPTGTPIGYIVSLNLTSTVRGFDLSECDYIIFDEFIKQRYEKQLNRGEGESVMELYKTISRDREHRGRPALKLIALANASDISNPLMETLELVDIVANMKTKHQSVLYIEERLILIHLLDDNEEFKDKEAESAIYKVMNNTEWKDYALGNNFVFNDFSSVQKINLKHYIPVCSVKYKRKNMYIYRNGRNYYMTTIKHKSDNIYDLNRENDQKRFYIDYAIDLRERCISGDMLFSSYSMYNLIVNYKNFFKL